MIKERLLANAGVYNFFKKIIIKRDESNKFIYIHEPGIRVLDVGCGAGDAAVQFLDAEYLGFDLNEKYIKAAKKKYENYKNIQFREADVNRFFADALEENEKFDLVIMVGVLHHLTDDEVSRCLQSISKVIKKDGAFRSLDCVYMEEQSKLERWFINHDRGKYCRTIPHYKKLVCEHIKGAEYTVFTGVLRVPYTHLVFHEKRE